MSIFRQPVSKGDLFKEQIGNFLGRFGIFGWHGVFFSCGRKQKKQYIETRILVDAANKEEMCDIFGEGVEYLIFFVLSF